MNYGIRLFNESYLHSQSSKGCVGTELGIRKEHYPYIHYKHNRDDDINVNSNYL